MATSFLKKTMVYLGLLDDEYDEYDEYDDRSPARVLVGHPRPDPRSHEVDEPEDRPAPHPGRSHPHAAPGGHRHHRSSRR